MWASQKNLFGLVKAIAAAAAAADSCGSKKVNIFSKFDFKHLKIFKKSPKLISVLEFPYILRILKKITKFLSFKGRKMVLKSKRIYF